MKGTRVYVNGFKIDDRVVITMKNISAQEITVDSEELTDAMFEVLSLPDGSYYGGTQWTIVYDLAECSATYHGRRDRAEWFRFFAGKDITANGKK